MIAECHENITTCKPRTFFFSKPLNVLPDNCEEMLKGIMVP